VVYGAVLILIIILIVLTKIAITPVKNLSTKNSSPIPKTVADLCVSLSTDKGEISCAEAKGIALNKYPGQISTIDKVTLPYQLGKPPKIQTEQRKVWLVNIKPNDLSLIPVPPRDTNNKDVKVVETVVVVVDRSSKEILFLEPILKK